MIVRSIHDHNNFVWRKPEFTAKLKREINRNAELNGQWAQQGNQSVVGYVINPWYKRWCLFGCVDKTEESEQQCETYQ